MCINAWVLCFFVFVFLYFCVKVSVYVCVTFLCSLLHELWCPDLLTTRGPRRVRVTWHGRKGKWSCEGTVRTSAGRGKRHQLLSGRLPYRAFAGLTHLISLLQNEMVSLACYSLALWQTLNWDHRFLHQKPAWLPRAPQALKRLQICSPHMRSSFPHPGLRHSYLSTAFGPGRSSVRTCMCMGMLDKIQQKKPQERTKNLQYHPKSEFFLTEQELHNHKYWELE